MGRWNLMSLRLVTGTLTRPTTASSSAGAGAGASRMPHRAARKIPCFILFLLQLQVDDGPVLDQDVRAGVLNHDRQARGVGERAVVDDVEARGHIGGRVVAD